MNEREDNAVAVKPLEWVDADEGMCTKWRAAALGGHYELVDFGKDDPGFAVNFHWGRPLSFWFIQGEPDEWGPTGPKIFSTLKAAKAAAQADYERRILSALAHPPAQAGAVTEAEPDVDYEVWQNGGMVASSSNLSDAKHYAAVYSQDGPVEIVEAATFRRPLPTPPVNQSEGRIVADLLNCPFCGGPAKHYSHPDYGGWSNTDSVSCENEDCGCGTCLHESREQAITAWNRRSTVTPADEDPHTVMHVYEGDGGVIIRENGNVSSFGVQSAEVRAAFNAATAVTPAEIAEMVDQLRAVDHTSAGSSLKALRALAPIAPERPIEDHKWLDPECGAKGCQSLVWKSLYESAVKGRSDFRQTHREIRDRLRAQVAGKLRTGDHVYHIPSGETWVVAWADYETGDMSACGWPESIARISDCALTKKADDAESAELVESLSKSGRNDAHRAARIRALIDQDRDGK